jgi:starch synthase
MVTSEAAPFAKTGGLADVLGSLPAALVKLGEEVAVVMPRYATAQLPSYQDGEIERIWHSMPIAIGPHQYWVAIDQVVRDGVRYLFVDCPPLYDRAGLYNEWGHDYTDNHLRFGLLNQAAIAIARNIFRTDVFHTHDWQAGLLPVYLKEALRDDPTFYGAKSVLTIHNLGYQGNFDAGAVGDLGLNRAQFHPEGLEFWGRLSFLKAGIVWSDAVTTVSPTYAQEIQTPEYGFSLDGLLRRYSSKLEGIINGVDYNEWNPATDPHLPANYSTADLSGKRTSKLALMKEMGLEVKADRPLIGIISRFADQKGLDLIAGIEQELVNRDLAMVVLGSGDPSTEDMFGRLAYYYPDRFAARIGYDGRLSHRIEAGADIFLMPSRYEPCGLNQIYSLRYGTLPIVRATGGLQDTVDESTGFKFEHFMPSALLWALNDALEKWKDQAAWRAMMIRGMQKDFSWDASARQYQDLYRRLLR